MLPSSRMMALGRKTGSPYNSKPGSSVFHSPNPEYGPGNISQLLNDPEALASIIAETAANSIATKVFGNEQTVNSGIEWFTALSSDDLKVEGLATRAEGAEYPMVRITPADLQPLRTNDIGGKFRVTDEAVRHGVIDVIAQGTSLVSKGIIEHLDQMTVLALNAAAESTEYGVMKVPSWFNVQLGGATPAAPAATPAAAIIKAQTTLRTNGLLARGDLLILNPVDVASLQMVYGSAYTDLLEGLGIEVAISPFVDLDSAYLVGSAGLGGVVSKAGLVTETWRDPAIRSTWVQTYLEPAIYISRPSNVIRFTGTSTGQ